jgi:hypothetical protein
MSLILNKIKGIFNLQHKKHIDITDVTIENLQRVLNEYICRNIKTRNQFYNELKLKTKEDSLVLEFIMLMFEESTKIKIVSIPQRPIYNNSGEQIGFSSPVWTLFFAFGSDFSNNFELNDNEYVKNTIYKLYEKYNDRFLSLIKKNKMDENVVELIINNIVTNSSNNESNREVTGNSNEEEIGNGNEEDKLENILLYTPLTDPPNVSDVNKRGKIFKIIYEELLKLDVNVVKEFIQKIDVILYNKYIEELEHSIELDKSLEVLFNTSDHPVFLIMQLCVYYEYGNFFIFYLLNTRSVDIITRFMNSYNNTKVTNFIKLLTYTDENIQSNTTIDDINIKIMKNISSIVARKKVLEKTDYTRILDELIHHTDNMDSYLKGVICSTTVMQIYDVYKEDLDLRDLIDPLLQTKDSIIVNTFRELTKEHPVYNKLDELLVNELKKPFNTAMKYHKKRGHFFLLCRNETVKLIENTPEVNKDNNDITSVTSQLSLYNKINNSLHTNQLCIEMGIDSNKLLEFN